jgi:hypothetical protein
MSSKLNGLERQLTWKDYPRKRGTAPGPNQVRTGAYTYSGVSPISVHFTKRGGHFELVDNVTVSITFNAHRSWMMDWVLTEPDPFASDLLNHEQGHYTITALIARDYFVDVMLLQDQTFATDHDGHNAERKIRKTTLDKMSTVQNLYDSEVHPEQGRGVSRGPIQQAWDGFFETAASKFRPFLIPKSEWEDSLHHGYAEPTRERFTELQPKPMHITFKRVGADYLPVCERLIDILSVAGKTI